MDTVKMESPMPAKCPQCGTPLPAGALAGLCPACLLKAGAAADTITEAKQPAFNPPSVSELAAKFPQLQILELIGKGGMGAVYKARQTQLDRIVALKILPPGIGDDPAFAERFAREAKALAKLNHPGIVTIYDFGRSEGLFYFFMEYVDGVNLRQLLHAGRVSAREALAIVPQICDALQFAHDQGIVHRDIKPENILLDRRGRVKVADFGLAKIVGGEIAELAKAGQATAGSPALTESGKIMGTPQYMAPEQKERPDAVDHRADIYALGVVFYQMLTGELPGKRIEPPSSKVQIDVRLDEVVLRALEKKPELRYQQASVLKTQVETIATEMGSAGGKPGAESKPRNPKPELTAVEDWLALIDNGDFARSWETAAKRFQEAITKEEWVGRLRDARQPVGQVISRKLRTARRLFSRLTVKFDTKYAGLKAAVETVTFSREGDGQWRAIGYLILPAYAEESLSPLMAMRGVLKKFLLIELPIAIVILLLIRTFFLQPFEAETDAAAPEIPRGSHFLVWKLTRNFAPGDLIAYRQDGYVSLGRVARNESTNLLVNRNGRPDFAVPYEAVLGKVVSIYWRSSNQTESSHNFYIGQTHFPRGDSIEISAVERDENHIKVSGHYHLVSADKARLALFITTTNEPEPPVDPQQTIEILRGGGDFELVHPHPVPGLPHINMYDADGRPFAELYFGTRAEAAGESKLDLSDNTGPSPSSLSATDILAMTKQAYASLSSYRDTGWTTHEYQQNGQQDVWTNHFSERLGARTHYLVEIITAPHPFVYTNRFWSDGLDNFSQHETPTVFKGLDLAGNLSETVKETVVPTEYFNLSWGNVFVPFQLGESNQTVRLADDKVGDTDCYMVAYDDNLNHCKLWVGKQDFLIRRYRHNGNDETHENIIVNERLSKDNFLPAMSAANGTSSKLADPNTNAADRNDSTLAEQPPVVVETYPLSGARDVPPGETEIHVRFSKPMNDGSWSWSTAWENSTPESLGRPHYLDDHRTCVMKVRLEPGKSYGWWLNSEKFKNFQDSAGQPAVPYLLVFRTAQN